MGQNFFSRIKVTMTCAVAHCMLLIIYTEAYENLALNKPAWQEHVWPEEPFDKDWEAGKAVDGLYTDRSAGGKQCTISGPGQTTATWRVDLGSVVSISHIDIYYRKEKDPSKCSECKRFQLLKFQVLNIYNS
ncbi:uncharacterized protein LOC130049720 [Ostrea edulis]|uniref:uncharacterized protein LOC130049720 n=1 Tax=Ostrea edulis TaxID=37623 RepID=UPI0024AF0F12|nr:uncharacterized protein LOC130049720 [Ostrea edulis]